MNYPIPVFDADDQLRYWIKWHDTDPSPEAAKLRQYRVRHGRGTGKEAGFYLHFASSGRIMRFGWDYGRWDNTWTLMKAVRRWVSSYRNLHIK